MKKLLLFLLTLGLFGASAFAKTQINLVYVANPASRAEKVWEPPAQPMALTDLPHTENDINMAEPEVAVERMRENDRVKRRNNALQCSLALKQYNDAMDHYKAQKRKMEGTPYGRQLIMAIDKFIGYASEMCDPDCLEFVTQLDRASSDGLQVLNGRVKDAEVIDENDPGSDIEPLLLCLIFDDQRFETETAQLNGLDIRNTICRQSLVYKITRANGVVVTSGEVSINLRRQQTSGIQTTGKNDTMIAKAIEECLKKTAKRINDYFVTTCSIKLLGPKKDGDFDPDTATITVDGEEISNPEQFSIARGKHAVMVDMDGYVQKNKRIIDIGRSKSPNTTIKINMRKATAADEAKKAAKDGDDE